MVTFRQFIESEFNFSHRENRYSWMDALGKFYPLVGSYDHGGWARAIQNSTMEEMFNKRWLRITFYGDSLYAENDGKVSVNSIQKQNLIDCAFFNNMRKLVHDTGTNEIVLWDRWNQI